MMYCATRGGMVTTAVLRALAEVAAEHGAGTLRLTADQQIAVPGVTGTRVRRLQQLLPLEKLADAPLAGQIVTTAPVAGTGQGRSWLRPSTFADLLHAIGDAPLPGLLLADPSQPYVPLPGAHVQVLALAGEDQWGLRLTGAAGAVLDVPGHLRSARVPEALRRLAPLLERCELVAEAIVERIDDLLRSGTPEQARPLRPFGALPDALWLMEPDAGWDAGLIQDLCLLAQAHGCTEIGLTSTRALVLPGLGANAVREYEELAFLRRTAAGRIPWRQWLLAEPGLEGQAAAIASALEAHCPVNPGISLALQRANSAPATVHILLRAEMSTGGLARLRGPRFTLAAPDTNGTWVTFGRILCARDAAAAILGHLTRAMGRPAPVAAPQAPTVAAPVARRHQCGECLTTYDEQLGDPRAGVPPRTPFAALPAGWLCPVCGAPPDAFLGGSAAVPAV